MEGPYWLEERNGPASPEQDTCCRGGRHATATLAVGQPPCPGPGLRECTPIGTHPRRPGPSRPPAVPPVPAMCMCGQEVQEGLEVQKGRGPYFSMLATLCCLRQPVPQGVPFRRVPHGLPRLSPMGRWGRPGYPHYLADPALGSGVGFCPVRERPTPQPVAFIIGTACALWCEEGVSLGCGSLCSAHNFIGAVGQRGRPPDNGLASAYLSFWGLSCM